MKPEKNVKDLTNLQKISSRATYHVYLSSVHVGSVWTQSFFSALFTNMQDYWLSNKVEI